MPWLPRPNWRMPAIEARIGLTRSRAWGDVLMAQNNPNVALQKYDAALKYAPNCTALKKARSVAAFRLRP